MPHKRLVLLAPLMTAIADGCLFVRISDTGGHDTLVALDLR